MKKLSFLAMALLTSMAAMAEGYQVNLQSTKQAGMGHTGAALKLGAESMHFNPAGLGFLDKKIDLSTGATAIFSSINCKTGGKEFNTNNPVSTPLYVYAGFKTIGNLSTGISFTTPFGSTIDWGKDWAGAGLVQDIALKTYSFQPTLAYKLTDRLSIGAGLMIVNGSIRLSRAMVPAGALNPYAGMVAYKGMAGVSPALSSANQALLNTALQGIDPAVAAINSFSDIPALSTTLSGDASVRLGFNVGAMFDINDQWTVGISYRSKVMAKVKEGTATLDYANKESFNSIQSAVTNINAVVPAVNQVLTAMGQNALPTLPALVVPPLDKGTFVSELPLPSNLNIGISYKPNQRWTVTAESQFVGWGAYQQLVVQFDQRVLNSYSIVAQKKYKNTVIFRAGTQYAATDRLDLRFGTYYDQSPVKTDYLNPETPSMDKLGINTGASFRPTQHFSVDLALGYITGFGRKGSYPNPTSSAPANRFAAEYSARAFTASFGVGYTF